MSAVKRETSGPRPILLEQNRVVLLIIAPRARLAQRGDIRRGSSRSSVLKHRRRRDSPGFGEFGERRVGNGSMSARVSSLSSYRAGEKSRALERTSFGEKRSMGEDRPWLASTRSLDGRRAVRYGPACGLGRCDDRVREFVARSACCGHLLREAQATPRWCESRSAGRGPTIRVGLAKFLSGQLGVVMSVAHPVCFRWSRP